MANYPAHGTPNWDDDLQAYIESLPTSAGPFRDDLLASIGGIIPTTPTARAAYAVAASSTHDLAAVQAIAGLKWFFSPETGFATDTAGTNPATTHGAPVRCWKDASPAQDHATGPAGLTLTLGVGGAGVNIGGSGSRLSTTGVFDSSFNAGWTYFLVAHAPDLADNRLPVASADGRWYHYRNGSNQSMGVELAATSSFAPLIPLDIPTAAHTTARDQNLMVEAYRYPGPSGRPRLWFGGYPGQQLSNSSGTALALTGKLSLGGFLDGGFSWPGSLHAFVAFNRALSDAEVAIVTDYLSGACNVQTTDLILFGPANSLTAGTGASVNEMNIPALNDMAVPGYAKPGDTDLPSQVLDGFLADGREVIVRVDAYPGRSLDDMLAETPATSQAMFATASHRKRVAIIWEVTNDLGYNIAANNAAILAGTEPPTYTKLVTLSRRYKDQGWLVGVGTCLPRSDFINADHPGWFYRVYQHVNALIRANVEDFGHFVVDYAADPRIGKPGCELDTTYYTSDKVHMVDAGYAICAGIARRALDRQLG